MTLPEQIKAQIRWLAENLDHSDAQIAACALADEILVLVDNPKHYKSRATVEHEREVLRELLRNVANSGPFDFDGGRGWLYEALAILGSKPSDKTVISIDPDRMTDEERFDAENALLNALARLGWDIRSHDFGPGSVMRTVTYERLQITPRPEFRRHFFNRNRVCIRCGTSLLNVQASDNRTCPGFPVADTAAVQETV